MQERCQYMIDNPAQLGSSRSSSVGSVPKRNSNAHKRFLTPLFLQFFATGSLYTALGAASAFGWGLGARGAAARATTITLREIQAAGITLPAAQHWLKIYQRAIDCGKGAATAPERVKLMQRIIEILEG